MNLLDFLLDFRISSATIITRFNYQLRLNLFGHCPWVIKPGNTHSSLRMHMKFV